MLSNKANKMIVTLVGTLPPIKGLSSYCQALNESLTHYIYTEFICFEKLYPEFLYPGGRTIEDGATYIPSNKCNTHIRNILTYYNPLSWIWAGLTIKGEIVHVQWWSYILAPIYITILSIAKIKRKRVIITVHNVIPHENATIGKYMTKSILIYGSVYIVHSEENKKELNHIYGIPIDKIEVIPLGTLSLFNDECISQSDARSKLDLPQESKIILFFGNIRGYKGLDVLLEALYYVSLEHKDVLLVIAGKPWVSWDYYAEIISKFNLNSNLRLFLDYIPENQVKYFYYSADLVVLPYKEFTAQSAAAAVTLSFGKPLIVSNVGGLPKMVKDDLVIVPPNDSRSLSQKLLLILDNDDLIKKLSCDSQELAKLYSWESVAKITVELYKHALV